MSTARLGPRKSKRVRDPVGRDARRVARQRRRRRRPPSAASREPAVVVGRDPDEDADVRARAAGRRPSPASSSASQATSSRSRCCGSIQHRLAGRDPEEVGVEPVDPVEEPARVAPAPARRARRPAGTLADGVDPVAQEPPERLRAVGAREPAADPDDRDRLGRGRVAGRPAVGASRRLARRGGGPGPRSSGSRRPASARAAGRATLPARRPARPPAASRARSWRTAARTSTAAGSSPSVAGEPRDQPAVDLRRGRRRSAAAGRGPGGRRPRPARAVRRSTTVSSVPARNASRQAWRWTLPLEVLGRLIALIRQTAWTSRSCCLGDRRRGSRR